MRRTPIVVTAVLGLAAGLSVGTAQQRPLPDPQIFMAEARQRVQEDEVRQQGYVFLETRREQRLDRSGNPVEESVRVFESFPGLPGERRWRRLIEEDGKPVPATELERQARERLEHVRSVQQAGLAAGPDGGAGERRSRAEERLEDAFRVFQFEMLGRERRDGHDTIVFSLTPRPNAQVRTREGRIMRHFHGRAWVSESDHELVRLEAEALSDVTMGFGILGRVHKGSRFSFERQKVDSETWLPVRSAYTASARVLLVRRIHMAGSTEYSDYRPAPAGPASVAP